MLVIVLQGAVAYRGDRQRSAETSSYSTLGQGIEAALPANVGVLGPEVWWWPLHAHPYLALRSLWRQWAVAAGDGQAGLGFGALVRGTRAQVVVVNADVRADVTIFPETLQDQFWAFPRGV